MFVFALLVLMLWPGQDFCVKGVTLSPCGVDGTAEVPHNRTTTFLCTGLSAGEQIVWYLTFNSNTYIAGVCPSVASGKSCEGGSLGIAFKATRVSATSGKGQVYPSYLRSPTVLQQGVLWCSEGSTNIQASCQLDYIVPANGSCSVQTGSGSSRFEVNGSCDLYPGAVSSRGRYRCEWYLNDQKSPVVNLSLTSSNYETGCSFLSHKIPTTAGIYNYTVKVFPGRNILDAGSIVIERPAIPVISGCDSKGYRERNTTVTCSCSTNSTGNPPGDLQWLREDKVLEVGDHGNGTLPLSRLLMRRDHNVTFRCKVAWAADVPEASFSFLVGYPPTNPSLTINAQAGSDVTVVVVREHQSVTFRCASSEGNPEPTTVTLVKRRGSGDGTDRRSTVLGSGVGELRIGRIECEGSGEYLCSFNNGLIGSSEVLSESKRLLVECSPRLAKDFLRMTFTHDVTSVHFDVISYPEVNRSLIEYLGPSANQTQGFQPNDSGFDMGGNCRRTKPWVLYQSTCSLTMPGFGSEAPSGFYRVTVMNFLGNVSFVVEVNSDESKTLTTRSTDTDVTEKDNNNNNNSNNNNDNSGSNEEQPTINILYLWVATGLGSAALVICLVIIVVLAVRLRRQRPRQPADQGDVIGNTETYEVPTRSEADNVYSVVETPVDAENQDYPRSSGEEGDHFYSPVEYSGSERRRSSDRKSDDSD